MQHEWEGPCGLQPRLALAFEDVGDEREMAELLDVTPQTIHSALWDPSYTPTPEDLASMWANLYLVAGIGEHTKRIGAGPDREIIAWSSALWSAGEIANLPLSNYVREFAWVF